jgi:hypothetical protein
MAPVEEQASPIHDHDEGEQDPDRAFGGDPPGAVGIMVTTRRQSSVPTPVCRFADALTRLRLCRPLPKRTTGRSGKPPTAPQTDDLHNRQGAGLLAGVSTDLRTCFGPL